VRPAPVELRRDIRPPRRAPQDLPQTILVSAFNTPTGELAGQVSPHHDNSKVVIDGHSWKGKVERESGKGKKVSNVGKAEVDANHPGSASASRGETGMDVR